MIYPMTKLQMVAVLKHVTGSGGDYARRSIEQYRELVQQLDPEQVNDAIRWLRIPPLQ